MHKPAVPFITLRGGGLELENAEAARLSVDGENLAGRAFAELAHTRPIAADRRQIAIRPPGGRRGSCSRAERAVLAVAGEVAQVLFSIPIEVGDLCQGQFFGRIHQERGGRQSSLGLLEEDVRLLPAQDDQVVLAVAVEIARRHGPLRGGNVGDADGRVLRPLAGGGLHVNDQPVGHAQAGDVGAAVAVKIADGHRGQLFVDGDGFVLESPVAFHVVDVGGSAVGRGGFLGVTALEQQVDSPWLLSNNTRSVSPSLLKSPVRERLWSAARA